MNPFIRNQVLLGNQFIKIQRGSVAIIGLGGVGSHAAMALSRMGLGRLILMDPDTIKTSNFNRHAQGFTRHLGKNKAEAIKEEILSFRSMDILTIARGYDSCEEDALFSEDFDLLIDCIDVMTYKLRLLEACQKRKIPFISSLGTGNRLKPTELEITTLYKSEGCPMARVLRKEARKREMEDFPVVLSREKAKNLVLEEKDGSRHLPASSYFTPAAAGQLLAYWAIERLLEKDY
ncbi:MAG: tRNA threonylcarbamoyladenosine dehydratase [Tissierellia bacterium]|nr:tRNA threonylcarbamoyladenosine dehydratase [Tissierellia bacterium]